MAEKEENLEKEQSLFEGINFDMFVEDEVDESTKQTAEDLIPDEEDKPVKEPKEKEGKKVESSPSDESDDISSSSSYQVLAQALSEEGVFSISEEDLKNLKDANGIIDLVQKEINSKVEEYKKSLPKDVQELLEGYEDGADLDQLTQIKRLQKDFSSINVDEIGEHEDQMRKVLKTFMELRGMEPEDIDEEIEDIFSLGKEEARSKKALTAILKFTEAQEKALRDEAKAEEARQQKAYEERKANIQKSVYGTEDIGGVAVNKKVQEKAFKAMTEVVANVNGVPINAITKSRMEDPVEFDKNVAVLWALTNGFKEWDVFKKAATKKAVSELDAIAENLAKQRSAGVSPTRMSADIPGTILSDLNLDNIK